MNSWNTVESISVTSEVASQIGDTLMGGLISNWGRRLVEEERRLVTQSAQLLPLGGVARSCGPAGAVLSPCGGLDGQHIFSSSACRCNGLTVSSIKVCGPMQWTAASGCGSHWTSRAAKCRLFLFLLFLLLLAELQPKGQN